MSTHSKLFSESKPHRKDGTGDTGNVLIMPDYTSYLVNAIKACNILSLLLVDANGQWNHSIDPWLRKDIQGMPIEVIGNSSNVKTNFVSTTALLLISRGSQ